MKSAGEDLSLDKIEPKKRRYCTWLRTKEDMIDLVEPPLLRACEILYDKNIRTLGSSANRQNVEFESPAFISLDFLSLSPDNQTIAKNLIEQEVAVMIWDDTAVSLEISINESTTSEEISRQAIKLAESFAKQPPNWIPISTNSLDNQEDCYYGETTKLFYLSEEHKNKVEEYMRQNPDWIPRYSIRQLIRDKLMDDGRTASELQNYDPRYDKIEYWVDEMGYYYDEETGLFYLSESDMPKLKVTDSVKMVMGD